MCSLGVSAWKLAVCLLTASDQDCGWNWFYCFKSNTGCKRSRKKWEHELKLQSSVHFWRYRQPFTVLWWDRTTGNTSTTSYFFCRPISRRRTTFYYQNGNSKVLKIHLETSNGSYITGLIPFPSLLVCPVNKWSWTNMKLAWDQLGYAVLGHLFSFLVKTIM